MATVATLPPRSKPQHKPVRPDVRELTESMDRVKAELSKVRANPDFDNVHDLRVAIRRCRSVALVFEEVDPDPAWEQMRKCARKLFRSLGALRDAHVMEDWIKKILPAGDPIRLHMLDSLEKAEPGLREEVLRVAAKFDEPEWMRLQGRLKRRVRFLPVCGLAAECLAWERCEEIKYLHAQALRSENPKPWHELRIGLKKLRYTVESLLPVHHAAWIENLKRLQDLLGDVHDLDVLAEKVKEYSKVKGAARRNWSEMVDRQRVSRLQTYRHLTLGQTSIWNHWKHALPHGERLEKAAFARLRATARAASEKPMRAAAVARIASRIFDQLKRVKADPLFSDTNTRRIFRAAAMLHAVQYQEKNSSKAARKFLESLTIPPRWTPSDWQLVGWAVRFHRGAEPGVGNTKFGRLSASEQQSVRALAGVIRLGRVLLKCGIQTPTGMKIEKSPEAITLLVPNLVDSSGVSANIAAGKHLLETALGVPLIVRPTVRPSNVIALVSSSKEEEPQKTLVAAAHA